ncbi:MAG: S-adenosylmethionine-binding protein, partial [Burkholderiaceae bacterium]|nr:S-adenosylmethionine-binding protein [Burkholderiaceae bacterium]
MSYSLHPLCTLFPRMAGAEFEALKQDILNNGLHQPIVLHDGMVLDGGNRYRACLELGVEPLTEEYEGDDIVAYVLSANLHRRHMSPGQQAAIVASAQDWDKAHKAGRSMCSREHFEADPNQSAHVSTLG